MHPVLTETIPDINKLPGGNIFHSRLNLSVIESKLTFKSEGINFIADLLCEDDVVKLINLFDSFDNKTPVSALGRIESCNEKHKGSERISLWAPELSDELYSLLHKILNIRELNNFSRTDWWQFGGTKKWKPIGLSPLLRFMSYSKGSVHLPHYDAAFFYPDKRFRTLMSVILYLSTHENKSATRILDDKQDSLPERERKHNDFQEIANPKSVKNKFYPKAGSVLIFDHRILHDTEIHEEEKNRILIRTDLVFEKI